MTDTKEKESQERITFTKKALENFLRNHNIREEDNDSFDEIVLSYLVTALNELGDDFDFDAFEEMMAAYIPGFENIPSDEVCKWIFHLFDQLHQDINKENITSNNEKSRERKVKYLTATSNGGEHGPEPKIDENNPTESLASGGEDRLAPGLQNDPINQLLELFPSCSITEAKHFLSIAKGQLEEAAQLMLLAQDPDNSDQLSIPKTKQPHRIGKGMGANDKELHEVKEAIIKQYGYVDVEEEEISHNPRAPKWEGKKMVRYREGQIVSKKGEKYQIEKDEREESDSMKKTYINLKQGKKYRFH